MTARASFVITGYVTYRQSWQ